MIWRGQLIVRSLAAGALLATVASGNVLAQSAPVTIGIVDAPRPQPKWGYAPGTRKIAPGTWVSWSNAGQDAHTVTAIDGSFDSGNLDPSEDFSWYFDQPGTFRYICTLHPWMTGSIVVGNGQPPAGIPQPQPQSPAISDPNSNGAPPADSGSQPADPDAYV